MQPDSDLVSPSEATPRPLTHPNIVTVFDFGAAGADGTILAMEFVEGRTLRHELNRPLPGATVRPAQ